METAELRFWNKNDALEKLMKHLGLIGDTDRGSAAQTPEEAERAREVREKFTSFLDEIAARSAAPAPPLPER